MLGWRGTDFSIFESAIITKMWYDTRKQEQVTSQSSITGQKAHMQLQGEESGTEAAANVLSFVQSENSDL